MKLGVLIVNSRKPVPPWLLRLPEVGDVSVITEPPYAGDFPPEVEVRTVPSIMDVDAVRRAALDVMRVRPVDRVLSPAEHAISTSGYLRSTLGLPGLGHEASLACSNKYVMKREFVRAGLPVTPSARSPTWAVWRKRRRRPAGRSWSSRSTEAARWTSSCSRTRPVTGSSRRCPRRPGSARPPTR
ncbi:hypothetical protein ACFQ2Y_48985 [Streptomyces malaysiensis subsp. malaysiensis]